jgi:hypothetical protein
MKLWTKAETSILPCSTKEAVKSSMPMLYSSLTDIPKLLVKLKQSFHLATAVIILIQQFKYVRVTLIRQNVGEVVC